jgi:hypothetical protein
MIADVNKEKIVNIRKEHKTTFIISLDSANFFSTYQILGL